MQKIKKQILPIIAAVAILVTWFPGGVQAYEYSGMTFEVMNNKDTNFYGLGFFTSDTMVTAGVTLMVPTYLFLSSTNSSERDQNPDTHLWNRDYPYYSLLFWGQYNFIRTSKTAYFASFGIMPFIPTKYVYAFGGGVEFFQSESVRFIFSYKNIFSNYVTTSDGSSSHLNRIAQGSTFTFAIKFALVGKKEVKFGDTKPTISEPKKRPVTKRDQEKKVELRWGRERD